MYKIEIVDSETNALLCDLGIVYTEQAAEKRVAEYLSKLSDEEQFYTEYRLSEVQYDC